MLPSMPLFLGRVAYVPEKRQIVAEFSGAKEKASKRYSFFPRMFFPLRGIPEESFRQALSGNGLKRVKVDFEGGNAVLFAADFSDLKAVNNLLGGLFGFSSNLVEPERQFLIEKGWGYFDAFDFSDGAPILRAGGSHDFPEIRPEFLSGSLGENVTELLSSNRPLAEGILRRVAASRLLKVPLLGMEGDVHAAEIFLENVFFASSAPLGFGPRTASRWRRVPQDAAELDFSRLISIVAAQPFNNVGLESVGCACCRPASLSGRNVLPSSLVRVRFLSEGFYFNPSSHVWAAGYHESHAFRDERVRRKAEYFYHSYPAGPFSRGQEEMILLADAMGLQAAGSVEVLGEHAPEWCCSKSESALSAEINRLKGLLSSLSPALESERVSRVASGGLFALSVDSSPRPFYMKALADCASSILSSVPSLLSDPGARFFSRPVAIAFECIKGGIISELGSIASSSGCEVRVPGGSSSILVGHSDALGISRRFSDLYRLGKPFIDLRAGI